VAKLVEDKANGPAVIQELKHDVAGLIEVQPEGGKIARAHAVSPIIESGNVYLPHPALHDWVEELIEETATFPHGRHDDQVDAMTQALNRLRRIGGIFQVTESELVVAPCHLPSHWPRAFGLAIAPHGVAALWGARDSVGTIYIYAEHQLSDAEPSQNARAIQRVDGGAPGVISAASLRGAHGMRKSVAQIYRKAGLEISALDDEKEAGVYRLLQMLREGRIKVFASMAGFLSAYRSGDSEALLLQSCQALILSPEFLWPRSQPKSQPDRECGLDSLLPFRRDWMAG
jgi:hypothetical protein